jgi:hypothetical protein
VWPQWLQGGSASYVWGARELMSLEERGRYRDPVDRLRRSLAAELQSALYEALNAADRASLDRMAVPQALVERGLLRVLRSVVTPAINSV